MPRCLPVELAEPAVTRGLGAASGVMTGAGEAAGDDGAEAVARRRRWAMMGSNSSYGSVNSSRKNGWLSKFCEGDGDRFDIGERLDLWYERYPSASNSW